MHVNAGFCVIEIVVEDVVVVVEIGEEEPELIGLAVRLGSDEEAPWDGLGILEGDVTLANFCICKISVLSTPPPIDILFTNDSLASEVVSCSWALISTTAGVIIAAHTVITKKAQKLFRCV